MKRNAHQVAKSDLPKPVLVAVTSEDYAPKRVLPDYVKVLKSSRINLLKLLKTLTQQDKVYLKAATVMRAMNIINAFSFSRHLKTVECGDLRNGNFADALHMAFMFMSEHAENVHNKAFKSWIMQCLADADCSDVIYKPRKYQILI